MRSAPNERAPTRRYHSTCAGTLRRLIIGRTAGARRTPTSSVPAQRMGDLGDNGIYVAGDAPAGVMRTEPAGVADPPDVVADPGVVEIGPVELAPGVPLSKLDSLQH